MQLKVPFLQRVCPFVFPLVCAYDNNIQQETLLTYPLTTADWTDQRDQSQYAWQPLGCDNTQTLQHNPRAATPQPRTPPTVAEIIGIRKAQHTIKCRKPRKAIAASEGEKQCSGYRNGKGTYMIWTQAGNKGISKERIWNIKIEA